MKLCQATIEIRPRNNWEAIDLGILLAKRHSILLLSCWFCATLPIFLLLTVIFWQTPLISFIIFWWLKPIFEKLPLYIISNTVFGNIPTIKETLLIWLKQFISLKTLSDLTIYRFSLSRSYNLAIKYLENLTGTARKSRLRQLYNTKPPAKWLTIVFIHFEVILISLIITIFFMLIPSNIYTEDSLSWYNTFLDINSFPIWQIHLYCTSYVVVLIFSESFYVSCGFCLYLNSRTLLESWDIELVFRRLAERLAKTLPLFLIICGVFIVNSISNVRAETIQNSPPTNQSANKITQVTRPNAKLIPLVSELQTSRQQISTITKSPPFFREKEVTFYRWKPQMRLPNLNEWLSNNFFIATIKWFFDHVFTNLIWGIIIFVIIFLIWYYSKLLPINKKRKLTTSVPEQLFGLAITPDSLPSDILKEFEKYWLQGNVRQAISLLYRALLSHLVNFYHLPLSSSNTEREVIKLTYQLPHTSIISFTEQLTNQWLQLAYGHQSISLQQKQQLIDGWKLLITPSREVKK